MKTESRTGTTTGIETEFLYDPAHRLMTEINAGTEQMTRANIYAGGEFMAEDSPDPFLTNTPTATQLRVTDQVGSLRGLIDIGNPKSLWSGAWKSFPYGDGAVSGDGSDSQNGPGGMLFTGKKRDAESNLDYFGARFYSSMQGRFMSPDWATEGEGSDPVPYADLTDPQSLNLYSYVRNNPLSKADKDGHDPDDVYKALGTAEVLAPEATPFILGAAVAYGLYENRDSIIQGAQSVSTAVSSFFSQSNSPAPASPTSTQPGQKDADFVVTPAGTTVATDPGRVRDSLANAPGVTTTPANSPSGEQGTIQTGVKTPNGPVDVRTMDGSSSHGSRTVITHPGTNNPKTPDGKATNNKNDNHIPNDHERPQ